MKFVNHTMPDNRKIPVAEEAQSVETATGLFEKLDDYKITMDAKTSTFETLASKIIQEKQAKIDKRILKGVTPRLLKSMYLQSRLCKMDPWDTLPWMLWCLEVCEDFQGGVQRPDPGLRKPKRLISSVCPTTLPPHGTRASSPRGKHCANSDS
jgi:hypothetical protein